MKTRYVKPNYPPTPCMFVEIDKAGNHVKHHHIPLKCVVADGGYTEVLRYTGFCNSQPGHTTGDFKCTWHHAHIREEIDFYFNSIKRVGDIIKDPNYYSDYLAKIPVVHHNSLNDFFAAIGYEWPYKRRKNRKTKP